MNTKTKGILAYLLIAFGGAWTVWVLLWLVGLSPTRTSLQFQLLSLPAECAPAIAVIIVRLWVTRERFTDAGLRLHIRMNRIQQHRQRSRTGSRSSLPVNASPPLG